MNLPRMFVSVLVGVVLGSVVWDTAALQGEDRSRSRAAGRGAAATSRKVTGIVTAKTDKEITVKAEGTQQPQRFLLVPPTGDAPAADVQAALKMVFVTNLVVLQCQGEEEPVVTSIRPIHSKTRFGIVTGTVVAADSTAETPSFDVKPSGRGFTERYLPRWDAAAKGWDRTLVGIIAGLSVGDKVKVAWSYDERKRANQVQVVRKARQKTSSKPDKKPPKTP